jgi:hypothetical protein
VNVVSLLIILRKKIRKKTFGILSTVTPMGRPHQAGLVYVISPPESPFRLLMATGLRSAKVKNIQVNPSVSFLVTFPHYYLRFAPAFTVTFRGNADFITIDDNDVQWTFNQKRVPRMIFNLDEKTRENMVIIRIKPEPIVHCFGLGIGINEIRKSLSTGGYKVQIPKERL